MGEKYSLFEEDFCYYSLVVRRKPVIYDTVLGLFNFLHMYDDNIPLSYFWLHDVSLDAKGYVLTVGHGGGIELLIVVYGLDGLDGDSGGYLAVYRDAEYIFYLLIINCTNIFIYFVQMVETKKFGHKVLTN